ncbi:MULTISPECIES: hypothetical protein [unclassified Endozoicomonas]|uniref:hypothetical protein n=1 Tax=unclassified Endozoicomonas TaxID=2644528 RepID=UPI002148862D|nr:MULTISPECIES: hypothetical protein [unclassified Endozoicomonas]
MDRLANTPCDQRKNASAYTAKGAATVDATESTGNLSGRPVSTVGDETFEVNRVNFAPDTVTGTSSTNADSKAAVSQTPSLKVFHQWFEEKHVKTALEMRKLERSEKILLKMSHKQLDTSEDRLTQPCGDFKIDSALVDLWKSMDKRERAAKLQQNMMASTSRQ